MKKLVCLMLVWICLFCFIGCSSPAAKRVQAIKTDTKIYYQLSDGSWECDGHTYKYKLEISGRMPDAAVDSTFVYLSNLENIAFDQACAASGYSSNTGDYFAAEDAILVDWIWE